MEAILISSTKVLLVRVAEFFAAFFNFTGNLRRFPFYFISPHRLKAQWESPWTQFKKETVGDCVIQLSSSLGQRVGNYLLLAAWTIPPLKVFLGRKLEICVNSFRRVEHC